MCLRALSWQRPTGVERRLSSARKPRLVPFIGGMTRAGLAGFARF